jgi:hypothetical protein
MKPMLHDRTSAHLAAMPTNSGAREASIRTREPQALVFHEQENENSKVKPCSSFGLPIGKARGADRPGCISRV